MTFTSLQQALHAGFELYDRSEHGYLVRVRTAAGWMRATVDLTAGLRKADAQHGGVSEGAVASVRAGCREDAGRRVIDARLDREARDSYDSVRTEDRALRVSRLRDAIGRENEPVPGSDGDRFFSKTLRELDSEHLAG
jgi:hypothetical protein